MNEEGFTISAEQAKKLASDTAAIGDAVESMLSSTGFKIFLGIFQLTKMEIHAKDDYISLDAFKADRAAIRIVENMFQEFRGYIDNANDAKLNLEKLIDQLGQTPTESLILGGEEGSEQG